MTPAGRTFILDGREYLFFSGYSYLAMDSLPEFRELLKEGLDKYGVRIPSSRISNTRVPIADEFEELLARITGFEQTVCFPSGFQAGQAAVSLFERVQNRSPSHPAIRKSPLTAHHSTLAATAFDSVDPLNAQIHLPDGHVDSPCIIDDSHGFGLICEGAGINGRLGGSREQFLVVYSLSKASNLIGGAVSCQGIFASALRASPFYTASTGIAPAFMHAFIHGQELYKVQREKLYRNIAWLRGRIKSIKAIHAHPELPVFILPPTDERRWKAAGMLISSFAYPDPTGPLLQRVVVNAAHNETDLERLAGMMEDEFGSH